MGRGANGRTASAYGLGCSTMLFFPIELLLSSDGRVNFRRRMEVSLGMSCHQSDIEDAKLSIDLVAGAGVCQLEIARLDAPDPTGSTIT